MEANANTEIAVHDYATRVASLMQYQGDNINSINIGRDMGWGPITNVNINGNTNLMNNANIQKKLFFGDSSLNTGPNGPNNSDPYYLEKVTPSGNNSSLRLTLSDDPDESFQIWGDSCRSGNCGGEGRMSHKFTVDGTADHTGPVNAPIFNIANKWRLGDTNGDDWLRMNSINNNSTNGYYGGFAAGKLWTREGGLAGSDKRMKNDINNISTADLSKLDQIQPATYTFKDDKTKKQRYGFIAQDVEKIYPSLVENGANGMKSLKYDDFIPLAVGNIQQLKKSIPDDKSLCIEGVCLNKKDVQYLKKLVSQQQV